MALAGKNVVRTVAQIGSYVIFLAVVLEGSTRLALSWERFYHRIAGDYNKFWRLEWVRRHQEQGWTIYYKFDVYNPTRGWSVKPGMLDEPAFKGKRLSSNSRGLRGKTEHTYEKPSGKLRVLVLGDSFTFGDDLNDSETYCSVLQNMLPATEIINMGVHGYGHDQMLIYLKEEGVRYRPDIVALGFLSMDLSRNVLSFRDFAKPRFTLENHQLVLTNSPVPTPEEMLHKERLRPKFLDIVSILHEKIRSRLKLKDKEVKTLSTAILDAIVRTVRDSGAIPVFVYIPIRDELIQTRGEAAAQEDYFTDYCAGNKNVICASLKPRFIEAYGKGLLSDATFHWKPQDHRIIAQGFCETLARLSPILDVAACAQ